MHPTHLRPKGGGSKVVRAAIIILVATGIGAIAWSASSPALIKLMQPDDPDEPPVVFKHWKHQRSYMCYTCHPVLFSKRQPAVYDHVAMDKGQYCGFCHNGKIAFLADEDDSDCEVCHAEE